MMVIVPNDLRDAIYRKVDDALACRDDATDDDREHIYYELLSHFNKHGVIPDFTLEKK